jgi:hypothetical protein
MPLTVLSDADTCVAPVTPGALALPMPAMEMSLPKIVNEASGLLAPISPTVTSPTRRFPPSPRPSIDRLRAAPPPEFTVPKVTALPPPGVTRVSTATFPRSTDAPRKVSGLPSVMKLPPAKVMTFVSAPAS